MTKDQIKHMVDRFLNWKLPSPWRPDGGISFERYGNKGTSHEYDRAQLVSGTNLFDFDQATAMVKHMLEGLPPAPDALDDDGDWRTELARLRSDGWAVAVHNDYRQGGERHTFWLLTHPSGRWIKGEGKTDDEALAALTAEQAAVPPDGEALARRLDAYRELYGVSELGRLIREAAAALRSPASEEVEALARRLEIFPDMPPDYAVIVGREAAALLRRLSPADGWRPIESGPRDGTLILLSNGHDVDAGWWGPQSTTNYGWCVGRQVDPRDPRDPTHWRPLPAPPSSETEEG